MFYKGARIVIQSQDTTAYKNSPKELFADLVWIGNIKSGIDHSLDLPTCRIILYHASKEAEKEVKEHHPSTTFNVNSSVQLLIQSFPFENKNQFICQYFNQRKE